MDSCSCTREATAGLLEQSCRGMKPDSPLGQATFIRKKPIMSLDAGRNSLMKAHKNLQQRWLEVQLYWHDAVQKEFAEQHWEPLGPRIIGALAAVDRLGQVLLQMRRECSAM